VDAGTSPVAGILTTPFRKKVRAAAKIKEKKEGDLHCQKRQSRTEYSKNKPSNLSEFRRAKREVEERSSLGTGIAEEKKRLSKKKGLSF